MCTDWQKAKNDYINRYWKDDNLMQQIAEKAFDNDAFSQDMLAEWFENKGELIESTNWRNKAMRNREEIGITEND